MTDQPIPEDYRAAIAATFPDLSGATLAMLSPGWDCEAVDVDGRWVCKFPRHPAALESLKREASLLAAVRSVLTMAVPDLTLHAGPPPFSRHAKLAGAYLLSDRFEALPIAARDRLAADLALFFAELHRLDSARMAAAGAGPIRAWMPAGDILRRAVPVLPDRLRPVARATVSQWRALPPDPHGMVFGIFDGHGWNMAFDHDAGRLNGVYDFGDAGFGPLHQEFVYPNWISRDLTGRIVDAYERLTGRALDRRRIEVLSGILRLSELAEYADHADHVPGMIGYVTDWFGG